MDKEIIFPDRSGLTGIANHHNCGGEIYEGMDVFCERNYRSDLIPGKLVSWHIGSAEMDLTGIGKYTNGHVMVDVNGDHQKWPFSMILIKDCANANV